MTQEVQSSLHHHKRWWRSDAWVGCWAGMELVLHRRSSNDWRCRFSNDVGSCRQGHHGRYRRHMDESGSGGLQAWGDIVNKPTPNRGSPTRLAVLTVACASQHRTQGPLTMQDADPPVWEAQKE